MFVGGGTPSLLGGSGLAAVLDAVREHFTLAPEAEVTTEANPESTSPQLFEQLRTAGFTRVSLGMQSVAPHVLAVLDRVHSPGRALDAAREARAAGFEHVSLDLIYGTPGESDDDLLRSVDAAVEARVDHVSAYALVVEDGTALARRVRRGEVSAPDNDELAHRYELIDARLSAAGFRLVRGVQLVPARRRVPAQRRLLERRRVVGRRAGRARFRRHDAMVECQAPQRLCRGARRRALPVADFERLDAGALHTEDVMLRVRLRDGLPVATLNEAERRRAQTVIEDGLLARDGDRLILTDPGRLLADAVVRTLLD